MQAKPKSCMLPKTYNIDTKPARMEIKGAVKVSLEMHASHRLLFINQGLETRVHESYLGKVVQLSIEQTSPRQALHYFCIINWTNSLSVGCQCIFGLVDIRQPGYSR